jgi:hypothetical protein
MMVPFELTLGECRYPEFIRSAGLDGMVSSQATATSAAESVDLDAQQIRVLLLGRGSRGGVKYPLRSAWEMDSTQPLSSPVSGLLNS